MSITAPMYQMTPDERLRSYVMLVQEIDELKQELLQLDAAAIDITTLRERLRNLNTLWQNMDELETLINVDQGWSL